MHRQLRYATRGCTVGLDGWINCLRMLDRLRKPD
jgi:hypothetical protein